MRGSLPKNNGLRHWRDVPFSGHRPGLFQARRAVRQRRCRRCFASHGTLPDASHRGSSTAAASALRAVNESCRSGQACRRKPECRAISLPGRIPPDLEMPSLEELGDAPGFVLDQCVAVGCIALGSDSSVFRVGAGPFNRGRVPGDLHTSVDNRYTISKSETVCPKILNLFSLHQSPPRWFDTGDAPAIITGSDCRGHRNCENTIEILLET